jgi:hypothetical protein
MEFLIEYKKTLRGFLHKEGETFLFLLQLKFPITESSELENLLQIP